MLKNIKDLCRLIFNHFFMFILCGSVLFACQSPQKKVKKDHKTPAERYLSLSLTSEVLSLDPRFGIDYTSAHVIKMLFEGLMHINQQGEAEPALLQSYELSPDKKTYLITLRPSKWSNGSPVTAHDFEYSWKKTINYSYRDRSTAVHNFYVIKNVACYLHGKCRLKDIGVEAIDDNTLKVELENPIPYFLEALTNTSFFPICKEVDERDSNWSNKVGEEFVCNGPFYLQNHKCSNEIVVKRNPLFWDSEHVYLEGVKISIIKDNGTRLSLFEKNAIDWIGKPLSRIPLDAIAMLKKENKIEMSPSRGVYWYFINTEKFPFSNKKFRQALAYAINRKEITDYVLQEEEKPALGLFSSNSVEQRTSYFQDNDTEKAQELLKEALEELGIKKEELPDIIFSYNSDDIHQNVAQVIQEQLYKVLGVKVRLRHYEWKIHYNNMVHGDFEIGGIGWQPWIRDPIFMLQTFRNKLDGINMSRWENAEFKALLEASDNETDRKKRKELLHQAEIILMEEMPIIPIYFMSISYAKSTELKDVFISDLNMVDFRNSYFEEEAVLDKSR